MGLSAYKEDTTLLSHADHASAVTVDIDNVVALNAEDESQAKEILKPWDERLDEEKYIRSDAE